MATVGRKVGAVDVVGVLRPGDKVGWMDACDDRKSAWAVSYTTLKTRHDFGSQREAPRTGLS